MALVVRSTAVERARKRRRGELRSHSRGRETAGLLLSSVAVVLGLWLTYQAKTTATPLAGSGPAAEARGPLNLNEIERAEELLPFLSVYAAAADREFAAQQIYRRLKAEGPIPNVGALGKMRVGEKEIEANPRLTYFRAELARVRARGAGHEPRVALVRQVGDLKASLAVRRHADFRRALLVWSCLYLLTFYAVHLVWRARGFGGDRLLLPLIHLLTGVGLVMMVSLRDPLRDTLSFVDFAQGVSGGGALLLCLSLLDAERLFGRLSYVPLLLAVAVSALLIIFGSGPGGSDAKVNLWGFQPVELVKLLVVLFLAGYFAREWRGLRELREGAGPRLRFVRGLNAPRVDYVLPVIAGMLIVLLFFFFQKDLGPALVLSCVFLALYGTARGRFKLTLFGLLLMAAGFYASYKLAVSTTVAERIHIWLSPWDNEVRGGEQLVHSFWALAAGGVTGTGTGLGDPNTIPAVHTDLILSAVGEELGFVGVAVVLSLYALLTARGLRIALNAPTAYTCFLALGVSLLTALQTLLISLGLLGLIPLSGVVSPFLSFGRTSMLANFTLFGLLLAISARPGPDEQAEFKRPVGWLAAGLCALALVAVGKAAYVQVVRSETLSVTGALVMQGDGSRRYQYNPRIMQIARSITRGTIYDRNGIPLAASDWAELERHRQEYEHLLGRPLEEICARGSERCYPFGEQLSHLLGDVSTRANWAAKNTAYLERDSTVRLQGYDDHVQRVAVPDPRGGGTTTVLRRDYGELLPLLRHRYRPQDESRQRILNRQRNVRTSIDVRLQLRVTDILRKAINDAQRVNREVERGAVVVLDPENGDLLAGVSYPFPEDARLREMAPDGEAPEDDAAARLLDRSRFGLYPPGSTFKLVTAVAALRKDGALARESYQCVALGDGRVGNYVRGWARPVRDDISDRSPHGAVGLEEGIAVSCNAYFAQLGAYGVGAEWLHQTAELLGISVASPNTPEQLRGSLTQAAYGQGQVVASPFQMARVAATIAGDGKMPQGRWVTDDSNQRTEPPRELLSSERATLLARAMRLVVLQGTGSRLKNSQPPVAGKTGTAEVEGKPSHSWFVGFAPYTEGAPRRIAFAVIIEHGGYGGRAALPAAGEIVAAARDLQIIR